MKKYLVTFGVLFSASAPALVNYPYTFAPNTTIQSSQVNANFAAVGNEVNSLENTPNPFNTTLAQALSSGNSCGANSINFNENQALAMRVENLSSDPSAGNQGRVFINTATHLLKFDDGSTIQTVGGSGSNNLSSVLNSGNSAGAFNIDLNENQLLHGRVENQSSDPSFGNAGRLYYNTSSHALKVDSGSAWTTIGGSQGLSSVLGISNSAGSTNIDFNQNQAKNMVLDKLASDPGSPVAGQAWYNTTSNIPKFYNGTSYLQIGNTNTLAQTVTLGNSVGSNPIDFNGQQAQHMVLWNNNGSPGTGTGGYVWYDTGTSTINYETSGSNHAVCSLDQAQTITNHTISGASNTITNIQDSSLSSNVDLLNAAKTFTGVKTFAAAPVAGAIKSTSGANLTIPTGTGDDTFMLLGATQTASGKTLIGPTFTSNSDFSEGQALRFRVENLSTDPTPGNAGRLYYKTTTGELKYDTGSSNIVLATSNPNLAQVLLSGNSAGGSNIDLNENQLLRARAENLASLPSFGNTGRFIFVTTNSTFYVDTGSAWQPLGGGGVNYGTDTGAANAYVVAPVPAPLAYSAGLVIGFSAANANTGASTINVSGLGPVSLTQPSGSALTTGDILSGQVITAVYDGTRFQMISPQGPATAANTANAMMKRDASGQVAATTFTGSLTGTASGNTTYTPNQYGVVASGSGNAMSVIPPDASTSKVLVSGGASANPTWSLLTNSNLSGSAAISNANLATMGANTVKANITGSSATPTDAPFVSTNTASSGVFRDPSGNFSAGTITASLTGSASLNVLKAGDTMTGALQIPAGSAGAPSLDFTGATTTGLYSPGAGLGSLTAAGSEIARWGSGVSVGTTTIDAALHVKNTTDTYNHGLELENNAGTRRWFFDTSGTTFVIEDTGGNPFIYYGAFGLGFMGSQSPKYLLDLNFGDNSTDPTTIIPSNNAHSYPLLAVRNTNAAANAFEGVLFTGSSANPMAGIFAINEINTGGSETGHLSFYTSNSGASAEGFRIRKDKTLQAFAALDMGSSKVTSVTDPTGSQDAATKNYVDTQLAQLNPAAAVYAASTANIAGTYSNAVSGVCIGDTFTTTATTAFTLDGQSPAIGARVLFKDQTSSFQDGVWTLTTQAVGGVSGAILTRALDSDSSADFNSGQIVPIANGTVNAGASYYQTASNTTCNTSSQTWTQFQKSFGSYLTTPGTFTNHGVVIGTGTQATNVTSAGTSGQPLVSNGSSSDPTYQTLGAGAGGTGNTTLTAHGVLIGNGTGAVNVTSAGTSGQVLTSNGPGSDPTFQTVGGAKQVVVGTAITADATTTSATYASLSHAPTVSITAGATAKYRIYANVPANDSANGQSYFLKVVQTSGSATINSNSVCYVVQNGAAFTTMCTAEIVVSLVSGNAYTFELQGRVTGGTLTVNAGTENTEGSTGVSLIAQQLE